MSVLQPADAATPHCKRRNVHLCQNRNSVTTGSAALSVSNRALLSDSRCLRRHNFGTISHTEVVCNGPTVLDDRTTEIFVCSVSNWECSPFRL